MQLDREGRQVVGPQVKGAAAREVKPRMVPMAGEDAIGDRAAVQREAQMRAAIIHREHAALVVDHEDRAVPAAQNDPPLRLELLDRPGADEIVFSRTHHNAPCSRLGLIRKVGRNGSAAKTVRPEARLVERTYLPTVRLEKCGHRSRHTSATVGLALPVSKKGSRE